MDGMQIIRGQRGLLAKLARELKVTRGAVAMWDRVPAERLGEVARITGISPRDLRPDMAPLFDAAGGASDEAAA